MSSFRIHEDIVKYYNYYYLVVPGTTVHRIFNESWILLLLVPDAVFGSTQY